MKFFGRFNVAARDNALRGIALHSLLLMLYARAGEFADGLGIYVKEACQQLFEENAQSVALVRDNMEGMAAIQRSSNVTDWFVRKAEDECGVHPTVPQLLAYVLKVERGVRDALQRDFRAGYLPHLSDRQWLEYWGMADQVFGSHTTTVKSQYEFRIANDEDDNHPVSRQATGSIAVVEKHSSTLSRTCPKCMRAFIHPLQAGSDLHCPHCMFKISASSPDVQPDISSFAHLSPSEMCEKAKSYWTRSDEAGSVELAERLMEVSATYGWCDAQYYLGHWRLNGWGATKQTDLQSALHWLDKAAQEGDSRAIFDIGSMYANGILVERSVEKARDLWKASAAKGNDDASYALSKLPPRSPATAEITTPPSEPKHLRDRPKCITCNSLFVDGPGQTCPACRKRIARIQRIEEDRLADEKREVGNIPSAIIERRRCKVCNLDVALGYISDENICMYCAKELQLENAPRVTAPNPVSTKVTVPNSVSAKAPAQLDASDDFGDRMKALHKITPTDMCSAEECERHADLRLDGKLYCLAHYHMAKSAMAARNTGIKASLNPSATWPFRNGSSS